MFKSIKTGLLSVALLATAVANASKIVTIKNTENKTVRIELSAITEGETISVIDANGVNLYSEDLQEKDSYAKKFDFSTLPTGVYFIETKETKQIAITPVVVNEDKINILTEATKRFKAPEVKVEENTARILVKNFNEAAVSISIYDINGNLIKNESSKNLLIYQAYNFDNLEKGTYTISVTQGEYSFTEKVEL